jgi:predicted O-methyltransferase YrrM
MNLDVGMADDTNPCSRTASCSGDARQLLSLEELARPFVADLPDVDEDATALREHIVGQQARLRDIERQYAEGEAESVELRRQLSEQEGRAADLERQYAEAEAELIVRHQQLCKQKHWAADLERLVQLKLRLVTSGLVFLKSALKNLRVFFLTRGAFRWQQTTLALELRKARDEFRNAQEAVSDIEAVFRNLEDERMEQASRIDRLTRLLAQQEVVVAAMGAEIAQQHRRIEELMREEVMRERIRDQHFEGQPLVRLARSYRRDPWWPELQSLLKISMLHSETLYLLRSLAARTKDAIIEVGPYIGGSTIALGRGIQIGGGGPLLSVEMGGCYPSHAVPTNDIITDLKTNVEAYGLTGVVHIMEGFTSDPAIDAAVDRILGGRTIGLLFLDADGNVERDFELYRGRLSRGSILVYDDYITEQAPEKQTTIKTWVDQAVASGVVENLGLYRWGTWVGRYWG